MMVDRTCNVKYDNVQLTIYFIVNPIVKTVVSCVYINGHLCIPSIIPAVHVLLDL